VARLVERLTAKEIPKLEAGLHADGAGLYLRVDPPRGNHPGARRWVFIFHWQGDRKEMGLGPTYTVPLLMARDKAREARQLLLDGQSPLEAKRQRQAVLSGETFGSVADDLIKDAESRWKGKAHRQQAKLILNDYCRPLRDKPVATISTDDVVAVLRPIWTEKPETARRVRAKIEWVIGAAIARGKRIGDNPARWSKHLQILLPQRDEAARGHFAAAPYGDVNAIIWELRKSEGIGARALIFTILTAARTNETLGAKAEEFDLKESVWSLSKTRMKMKRGHRVPLSPAAAAVVEACWPVGGKGYLFRSYGKNRPLSNMAMAKALKAAGFGQYTVHGFRSTFKDWAADETEFANEVSEAALAHLVGDETEQAYRRSDAFKKRRKLMNEWASYCGRRRATA
jgi:integrase